MKTETFKVLAGEKCKIDTGCCGTTIKGPAIVVVLKEEAATGTAILENEISKLEALKKAALQTIMPSHPTLEVALKQVDCSLQSLQQLREELRGIQPHEVQL